MGFSNKRCYLILITVILSLTLAGTALAGDKDPDKERRHRVGFWTTYASAFDGDFDYDFVSVNPYWGIFLTDPGPGRIGSWEFALEGFYNKYIDDYSGNYEIGIAPTIRWHYGFEEFISPYVEFCIGVLYTDLTIPETGTEVNYNVHLGAGLNFRLSREVYLSAGYRLRHISNAGMSERNAGVNYHQVVLGISYYY